MIGFACIVPHAPILVKEVAQERYQQVERTGLAFDTLAEELNRFAPESVVLITPHGPNRRSRFVVCDSETLEGDLTRFRCPQVRTQRRVDRELVRELLSQPVAAPAGDWGQAIDWGASVPLLCLGKGLGTAATVLVGICARQPSEHFEFGKALNRAVERRGCKTAVVCSADLSHTVKPQTPAGEQFDRDYCRAVADWDVDWMLSRSVQNRREAAEDAVLQTSILMGALSDRRVSPRVLSYEAPFGVGYMVAEVEPE